MRLLRIVPFLALGSLAKAESSPASSEAELAARQVPAAQINVYCIAHEAVGEYDHFNATFEEACHDVSDRELKVGEQVAYEKCFDEFCITTLLVFKCGNETSTGSIDYKSCRTLFGLPFNKIECPSGGYVGSPAPGACWSALSLATPKTSMERFPALPAEAWSSASVPLGKRQAPQGVTACAPGDWQYSVEYDQFYQDASNFCDGMEKNAITLSTGEHYGSDNAYCNDETCLNFNVDFYCVAPGGGPAYGNVTWKGCMEFFVHPWWGYELESGKGPCVETQGKVIKGGWVTDVNPNACWNFSSLVLAPLADQTDVLSLPPSENYKLNWNAFPLPGMSTNYVPIAHQADDADPLPARTSTDYTPVARRADHAGVLCSKETFHDIIHTFCMLYEYCPWLNDEAFNLTQHYDLLGQEVTLSVIHSDSCTTDGKSGHDTCMEALEGMVGEACGGGDDVEVAKRADNCWDFNIEVEPST
ncbi:hypothetical protein PRZ48_008027 [Zasmidium cellare]|uniref:Uncharacterized protein n=1 Tax=Zasmidium cellare TaxID=395010 RepID=A0ABR0EEZ8_ZASCE|nr:hypothetical protein PRZ48_008027 [Zasmidium cellare]